MPTINCTRCGSGVEVEELSGDYSTFVCKACQEEINQPAYKAEMADLLANDDRTESEDRRILYLKAKISE